ncbi:MalY/PatB family protein [Heyndrickxia oleronia]|uniref:MalY/PatB family protein n=1 Tax=Heyndrickxia oleronia TaxID=38875 RepID=UPI001B241076|nr:MalY/PatB family protein [Heyndrickxia oleronia]GIN40208.1 cystathionine beta-lyase [Heyndrickxia oleronia]
MNWNDCVVRTGTHSVKWSSIPDPNEIIPMCIADMDFQVAPEIMQAMVKKAAHGIYGYTTFCERYYLSIIQWWKKRFDLDIDKEWISFSPGIIPGINILLQILTKPGEHVIVQEPVYYPFYSSIENHQCKIVQNSLVYKNGTYEMDFADLEEKASDPNASVLILCSPHNPVGRVWTIDELNRVAEICLKHNVWIISDEMHGDLVYKGNQHHPLFAVNPKIQNQSIICAAPSKTFNVAGLQTSIIMIPNKDLREQYQQKLIQFGLMRPNVFGVEGTIAAYESCEYWLEELLVYLEENLQYVLNYFKTKIPEIIPIHPEATHLIWLDCSQLGMKGEELFQYFLNEAKIKFDEGYKFGQNGDSFVRMNIACPRERLENAMKRIEEAVKSVKHK